MNPSVRIVYVHLNNDDLEIIENARNEWSQQTKIGIELTCFLSSDVDDDPLEYHRLVDRINESDFLLIRDLFIPKRFVRLDDVLDNVVKTGINTFIHSPNPEINDLFSKYYSGSSEDTELFNTLLKVSTYDNEIEILKHITNILNITNEEVILPIEGPIDGVYRPDIGILDNCTDFLDSLKTNIPTVGVLFRTNSMEKGDTLVIDNLVSALESKGLQTLPVFFPGKSRKGTGSYNSADTFRKYFMDGEHSRVDCIVVISPFSLLINSKEESGIRSDPDDTFLKQLTDVPLIQAMVAGPNYSDRPDMTSGIKGKGVTSYVAWPEIDGQIIGVPAGRTESQKGRGGRTVPIPDRTDRIAKMASYWCRLRRKKPSERRIAILVYQKRSDNGRLAGASGLDTSESIVRILKRMASEGYDVGEIPEDGRTLLDELLSGITNDISETFTDKVDSKAIGMMGEREYREHLERIPESNRNDIIGRWGEPPGEVCTDNGRILIPGIIKGNILIGIQPQRAWEEHAERLYHDPILPPNHQYLAYYRWIEYVFKADAIIHMGTHGSLEWLPGRSTGMSQYCYPDLVLNGLPNINPYIVDNPGEGIQAKRRGNAVLIDHCAPTMIRSELYGDLEELEDLVRRFLDVASTSPGRDRSEMLDSIRHVLERTTIPEEMGLDLDDLESEIPRIEDHLEEIKDTLIPNGLHVFGKVPEKEEIVDIICSALIVECEGHGSLRDSVSKAIGSEDNQYVDVLSREMVSILSDSDYDLSMVPMAMRTVLGKEDDDVAEVLKFACSTLVPNIIRTSDEMDNLMAALDGRFIVPGPPGALSRGSTQALPTGRNMYGLDPDTVPTPSAWANGVRMSEAMIERYVEDNGTYPRNIGFIIWATDTMKTGGDDLGYILWLLGVRPIWASNGHITDLEIVPLEELKRPRIDVNVRITGLFRDSFPNLISMINRAVRLVANLDESDENNAIAADLRREITESMMEGIDEKTAREHALLRVFGGMYGSYGAGVNHAIENRNWETVKDLGKMYLTWGGCGFDDDGNSIDVPDLFVKRFSNVDVGIKNMPDRQMDVFTGDDVYGYLGGMSALAEAETGRRIPLYVGDGADPMRPKVRTATEECAHVMRSKILNDRYIEGLKRHGFHSITGLARLSEYMLGWSATSDSMEDWMYDEFARKYILDDENRQWMSDENPYSLMEIVQNLLETIERGLWDADEEMKKKLKEAFIETEERLEEMNDR